MAATQFNTRQVKNTAVTLTDTQTLTNKTLTSPVLNGTLTGTGITALLEVIYPVGSIYISVVSTNPNTLFGFGTWAAFGAGRTLVGIDSGDTAFDTVEETGGAKTHTLSVGEMPAHRHSNYTIYPYVAGAAGAEGIPYANTTTTYSTVTGAILETGGGQAHNNLQPYIVTYMWKRTA